MSSKKTGIEGAIDPLPAANTRWWDERKILGGSGEVDWIEIGVVSYHQSLDDFPSEVTCIAIWPHWPVVAAFEDTLNGMVEASHPGITESTAKAIMRWAFDTARSGYKVYHFREQVVRPEGMTGLSAYMVSGPTATVKKYVYEFLNNVALDAEGVGGDDDYFDYYPDRVYCAAQLCVALGMEEEYKEAYANIMKRYKDLEPDVIPTWDETVPKEA